MDSLDVGIVGLDSAYWPIAYADAVESLPGLGLVGFTDLGVDQTAVSDNLGMSKDAYLSEVNTLGFEELNPLLEAADGVLVCTRHTRMPDLIAQALEAGVHVFAAKPVAIDEAGLHRIRQHLSEGVVFAAGQTGRSDAAIRAMLDLVEQGAVGAVRSARFMHQHGRVHDWTSGTWYTDPAEGNGCNYFGWYTLDAATAAAGPIEEIWGQSDRLADANDDQPDYLAAIAKHSSGLTTTHNVYLDVDREWEIGDVEGEIVGSDGIVRYATPGQEVALHREGGVETVPFEPEDSLVRDLRRWRDACRGEGEPALGGTEALHVGAAGVAWSDASTAPGRHATVLLEPE